MALKTDEKGRLVLSNTKIAIIWTIVAIMFFYLLGRLYWIQVLHPERLIAEGNARVVRNYHYEPPRGLIVDRNGKILAISVPVKTVDADPKMLHEKGIYADRAAMEKIAKILELNVSDLYKKTEDRTRRFVHLKHYLEVDKAKELKNIAKEGIILNDSYLRHYPTGAVNANLIGILNGEGNGVYGVEQSFNSYLSSTATTELAKKDRYDHIIENLGVVKQGSQGGNLVLSIDNRLQAYAHNALAEAVKVNDADSGTAVLIDVKTGEILALANAPTFDPNDRKNIDIKNAKNRAVTDIFEPGSTVKPLVSLAALELKKTNWGEVFATRPFIVEGKMGRDSHRMEYGILEEILKYS